MSAILNLPVTGVADGDELSTCSWNSPIALFGPRSAPVNPLRRLGPRTGPEQRSASDLESRLLLCPAKGLRVDFAKSNPSKP
jgi:hypothetical protein